MRSDYEFEQKLNTRPLSYCFTSASSKLGDLDDALEHVTHRVRKVCRNVRDRMDIHVTTAVDRENASKLLTSVINHVIEETVAVMDEFF